MTRFCFGILALLLLSGCDSTGPTEGTVPGRWYTPAQVEEGRGIYADNCATCHGKDARGRVADWRKPKSDGTYPPPPLNGTAHAWHHPLSLLKRTIREGGMRLGGQMPGFGQRLSEEQQEAVIAYFQNEWKDDIYAAWVSRGGPDK